MRVTRVAPIEVTTVGNRPGNLLYLHAEGSEEIPTVRLDIDEPRPIAREVDESGDVSASDYFERHQIAVAPHATEYFSIFVHATQRTMSFKFRVDYVIAGQQRHEVVKNPRGGNFSVSPSPCPPSVGGWTYKTFSELGVTGKSTEAGTEFWMARTVGSKADDLLQALCAESSGRSSDSPLMPRLDPKGDKDSN